MHSRIFCIVRKTLGEDEQKECEENLKELIDDEVYEDCQRFADYVNANTDLKQYCEWLEHYSGKGLFKFTDDTTFTIDTTVLKEILDEKISTLKSTVDKINSVKDLNSWTPYEINKILNDDFGFHFIVDERYNDYTLDGLLIELQQSLIEDRPLCLEYKVVKSFDYHY